MKTIDCNITSASEQIFSGAVSSISATGAWGEIGIMPGHSPLLTQLAPGPVYLRSADGAEEMLYLSGGFLEVQPDTINILADVALRSEQMDESELENARQQALADMQQGGRSDDFNYAEAAAYLAQLSAQLRTLKLIKQHKN